MRRGRRRYIVAALRRISLFLQQKPAAPVADRSKYRTPGIPAPWALPKPRNSAISPWERKIGGPVVPSPMGRGWRGTRRVRGYGAGGLDGNSPQAFVGLSAKTCLALMVLAGLAAAPCRAADPVPEPAGYRLDNFRSPVPATLAGVRVVTAIDALALWNGGGTLFIDVLPRAPKPANLPANTVWRDTPRASIPRAAWLPNVGYGRLNAEMDAYFRRNLEALTGGDKARPVLFFCLADCWMSWNAAKRAREEYGYTAVMWYPEGTDGWPAKVVPLAEAQPLP